MTTTDAKQKKKLCDRMITELFYGTPEGTRTPSLQNRNLTLYPIELRPHISCRPNVPNQYSRDSRLCKEKVLQKRFRQGKDFM